MKNFVLLFKTAVILVLLCLSGACKKTESKPEKPVLKPIPSSVTDIDGNTYNVIRIENKLWMTENLKVTRYDTESLCSKCSIPEATDTQGVDEKMPYFKDTRNFIEAPYTDNFTDEVRNSLGYLYNWSAAAGTTANNTTVNDKIQGICPNGWRLPTANDFDSLSLFFGGNEQSGKALKSLNGWYLTSGDNESNMNCYPAGLAIKNNVSFAGKQTMFWSTKSMSTNITRANVMKLSYNQDNTEHSYINKAQANSVRCVLDLDESYIGF